MKYRIAIWASAGFLIACCWVLYSFVIPPDRLVFLMKDPIAEAILFLSCPLVYALRDVPLAFWWVPLINAATYALIGLVVEALRRKPNPGSAV
jgi:hypothetical protein